VRIVGRGNSKTGFEEWINLMEVRIVTE